MNDAQKKAQKKYDLANRHKFRFFQLKFNRENDSTVVEMLEKQENIQGYIRDLILKDSKNNS